MENLLPTRSKCVKNWKTSLRKNSCEGPTNIKSAHASALKVSALKDKVQFSNVCEFVKNVTTDLNIHISISECSWF